MHHTYSDDVQLFVFIIYNLRLERILRVQWIPRVKWLKIFNRVEYVSFCLGELQELSVVTVCTDCMQGSHSNLRMKIWDFSGPDIYFYTISGLKLWIWYQNKTLWNYMPNAIDNKRA